MGLRKVAHLRETSVQKNMVANAASQITLPFVQGQLNSPQETQIMQRERDRSRAEEREREKEKVGVGIQGQN